MTERVREPMYKYEEIAEDIENAIREGALKAYDQLPTVKELCETYNVSKSTITQVINELSARGLIARRRGSGMFVKSFANEADDYWSKYNQIINYTEETARSEADQPITIEVYDFTVVQPEAAVCQALDLDRKSFTYFVTRGRKTETGTFLIEYIYVPLELAAGFKYDHANRPIHTFIEDNLGLKIGSIHRAIRAVMPTTEERARLQIAYGTPLLEIEQVGFLADGRPFEYILSHYRGDRYEFRTVDNL